MSQPPQPPQPPTPHEPQDPHDSQHRAAGTAAHPGTPQQPAAPAKPGLGKGPILAIVGCGLLVVVLVLSLAAFFGVRALMDDDDSVDQPTASPEEPPAEEESSAPEESTEPSEPSEPSESTESTETTEPTEEAAATGEANAVPQGTVLALEQPAGTEGTLDIVIGDVNWDAADWVAEQNSHNPEPTDQGKYIMVQAEVTYHGPAEFSSTGFIPVDYVAADGTPYEEAGVVTPNTMDRLGLNDGGTGTLYWVFMMPKDLPEGGHFVIADGLPQDEALVEGQWVQAV